MAEEFRRLLASWLSEARPHSRQLSLPVGQNTFCPCGHSGSSVKIIATSKVTQPPFFSMAGLRTFRVLLQVRPFVAGAGSNLLDIDKLEHCLEIDEREVNDDPRPQEHHAQRSHSAMSTGDR